MTHILYRSTVNPTVPVATSVSTQALTYAELDGNFKSLVDGKQEVLVYDSISRAYEDKVKFQYEVIQLNYQVDSIRVSQLQDMRHMNALMKQKVDIVTTQVKRQKRITVGVGILGLLGIIFL